MEESLVLLKHELEHLSEEVFTVENDKDKLIEAEQQLYLLFRKKNSFVARNEIRVANR